MYTQQSSMEALVQQQQQHSSSGTALSDCVQNLATSIYAEFSRIVQKYDEDAVCGLMPLVVCALESLESALVSQSELRSNLESTRAEFASQLERESRVRRQAEARLAAADEAMLEERESFRRTIASEVETRRRLARRLEEASTSASTDSEAYKQSERQVERLTKEISRLQDSVRELQIQKDKFSSRISYLECENYNLLSQIRRLEAQQESDATALSANCSSSSVENSTQTEQLDVGVAEASVINRVEVTRLLMERNAYKERLIELQDAMRRADCLRAAARLDQMRRKEQTQESVRELPLMQQQQQQHTVKSSNQTGRIATAVRSLFSGLWSSVLLEQQPVLGAPVQSRSFRSD